MHALIAIEVPQVRFELNMTSYISKGIDSNIECNHYQRLFASMRGIGIGIIHSNPWGINTVGLPMF